MRFASVPALGLLAGALLLSPGASAGPEVGLRPEHGLTTQGKQAERHLGKMSIPDVVLLNQEGRSVRFYSDLVKGKVVAINFVYTTCTTICPLLGVTFSQVQELLGDRLGKEVSLISVSVDPVTDTPQRLKAWGAKYQAKPGWTLVTGKKPEIDKLLRALGASTARKEDHPPTGLVGNDAKGVWTRSYGLAAPEKLAKLIEGMTGGRVAVTPKER